MVSIGSLKFGLLTLTDFNREACSLIKDFDVANIQLFNDKLFSFLEPQQVSLMDEMLTDSLFLDLARMCKTLNVATFMSSPSIHITSEALHEVYKMMIEKSVKLRKMEITITRNQFVSFLRLIGITHRDEPFHEFFSNRNIEAAKYVEEIVDPDKLLRWKSRNFVRLGQRFRGYRWIG
ncbi:hypothetical protein PRIPAC_90228 [Pristionchus pacificus]|nr:hypothetical protein PRIPAC_90228 [Pristionchus pacificus]